MTTQDRFTAFFSSIMLAFAIVFANKIYTAIAVGLMLIFAIVFSIFDQLLFLSPILDFYIPSDSVPQFALSMITSILLGTVIAMNTFILIRLGIRNLSTSMFSGTSLGMVSGVCASCTSLGVLLVSTFGGVGIAASNFLTTFQTPLRIISIGLLIVGLYSASKQVTKSCTRPRPLV